MESRLIARPRKTEDVLVSERLARQTAEAAQQAVGPQPQPAGAARDLLDNQVLSIRKRLENSRRSVETLM